MSIRESTRNQRDRWPLEFDLEGVPRQTAERERLLREHRGLTLETETEQNMVPGVTNSFAVDYNAGEHVVDINNPPQKRYVHQEFPRLVYHHESGHVMEVADEKQLKAAAKRGFQLKPAPGRDYSQIRGTVAAPKTTAEPREVEMSADKLVELDEETDKE